jgi:hypothetical protein
MASFMREAYSCRAAPCQAAGTSGINSRTPKSRENRPKNANDHEQQARVHPALPSYYVVVPTTEL